MILHHQAKPAVVLVAHACGKAVDHFQLQHEYHVTDQMMELQEMEQQGSGNVVGQVANNTQP